MTLFSQSELRPKLKSPGRDRRRRRRIPTGAPRVIESSADRAARAGTESWSAFLDAIARAAAVRLDLMKDRDGGALVDCPWARVVACDGFCRCGGSGAVTVEFLRDHYAELSTEILRVALPVRSGRSS